MAGKVKAIPEGYHSVTPYLIVDGAAAAIEFYKTISGATEVMRMPGPDGRISRSSASYSSREATIGSTFVARRAGM